MTDIRIPRLDDQLCVALYNASRAMTGCYRPMLEQLGITYSQYVVLLLLWEEPEVSLSTMGERLHLDSGTLSPLLKRMEKAGLVTRTRPARDERTLIVTLTEEGRALQGPAAAAQRRVEAHTGLEPAELADLRRRLQSLTARLRADRA